MSFLDDIKQLNVDKGPTCAVAIWLTTATPDAVQGFHAAAAEMSVPSTVIAKVMAKHGFTAGYNSVQRHRRGECKCS